MVFPKKCPRGTKTQNKELHKELVAAGLATPQPQKINSWNVGGLGHVCYGGLEELRVVQAAEKKDLGRLRDPDSAQMGSTRAGEGLWA